MALSFVRKALKMSTVAAQRHLSTKTVSVTSSHVLFKTPVGCQVNTVSRLPTVCSYSTEQTEPEDVNISNILDGVLKKYLVLIDVRDPEELRETGKIGRALNIPADEIVEAFKLSYCEFLAKYKIPKPNFMSERIVVYSKSVDISKEVCQKLKQMGYVKIKCYPGGIKEWNEVILGDLKKLEERQSMSPLRKCT